MKVIIIEGPDNCGKNTLIQNIVDNNDVVKVIHCHKPDKNDPNPFMTMEKIYLYHAENVIRDNIKGHTDVLIFNRYYQSEYIYGQLYRGGDPEKIKQMIYMLESYLINNIGYDNIYYVQLMSDSVKLLIDNEDGKSLSNGKEEQIIKELELFKDIFDFCKIKKKMIYINNGDSFKTKEDILKDFTDFINTGE